MELINLYNKKELLRQLQTGEISEDVYNRRLLLLSRPPMIELKDTYFSAIEEALEVESGGLWSDSRGRTFAGYAPVLASIGTLFAAIDNPINVSNRLRGASTREAWDVIDTVITEILTREKFKLTEKLTEINNLPDNAYNPEEQLSYLAQIIGDWQSLTLTGEVSFEHDKDYDVYLDKVSQISAEHPFVRSGEMANDVLGARIMAHALCSGMSLSAKHFVLLRELAKGPFLWRSMRTQILGKEEPLLDGSVLGYLLNSYWNDPMEEGDLQQNLKIVQVDGDAVIVQLKLMEGGEVTVSAIPPIAFYERVRNCEMNAPELEVVFEGATVAGGELSSLFRFQGENKILCGELQYKVKATEVRGKLWLGARQVMLLTPNPSIQVVGQVEYGWGGAVRESDPWKKLKRQRVSNPFLETETMRLLDDCQLNVPANGVVVMQDYSSPENDHQQSWARPYGGAVVELLKTFVARGYAERELVQTSGRENKYRIRINNAPWDELRRAAMGEEGVSEEVGRLVAEIERMLNRNGG